MSLSSDSYQLPAAPLLFLSAPQSRLGNFIAETRRLAAFRPEILLAIEQDLERHALAKKRFRLADEHWICGEQMTLPEMDQVPTVETLNLNLKTGRPRMNAQTCFFFWMLCTYAGGVKSRLTRDLIEESASVALFCREEGIQVPAASTLAENLSALSEETRCLILDAQIALAKQDGLDDFEKCQFDSTPVEANIAWPTDSALICKFIRRINARFKKLNKLGLKGEDRQKMGRWIRDFKNLDFQLNCCPKNQSAKLKALYNTLLDGAEVASQELQADYGVYGSMLTEANLKPSEMIRLKRLLEATRMDLNNLDRVIQHCHERINEGITRPVCEKVLSICDPDVTYMKKGNREAKIGYHSQLARSEKGLVTALIVPKGNTGDAPELQPLCAQAFGRTGVIPTDTSADGGYASKKNRKWLLDQGVKNPSFSSSKGKAITPEQDWQSETYRELRNWRSAVEALMSQLKGIVKFGRAAKRGWERVRKELTDKVLAFNFIRLALLRTQ